MSRFNTDELLGLEPPPMTALEAQLWLEGEIIPALAYYCDRTGVPSHHAWAYFTQCPPKAA
jgi:hypothetical protein